MSFYQTNCRTDKSKKNEQSYNLAEHQNAVKFNAYKDKVEKKLKSLNEGFNKLLTNASSELELDLSTNMKDPRRCFFTKAEIAKKEAEMNLIKKKTATWTRNWDDSGCPICENFV